LEIWNDFSNACKKTLAFGNKFGVASGPVQGLVISPDSFDGEKARFSGGRAIGTLFPS
jgi:hypothetical protein